MLADRWSRGCSSAAASDDIDDEVPDTGPNGAVHDDCDAAGGRENHRRLHVVEHLRGQGRRVREVRGDDVHLFRQAGPGAAVRARTSRPAASRPATTCRPTAPVAPVTRTVICCSSLGAGRAGRAGWSGRGWRSIRSGAVLMVGASGVSNDSTTTRVPRRLLRGCRPRQPRGPAAQFCEPDGARGLTQSGHPTRWGLLAAAAAPAATAARPGRCGRPTGAGQSTDRDGGEELDRVDVAVRARRRLARGAHRTRDLEGGGAVAAAEVVAGHHSRVARRGGSSQVPPDRRGAAPRRGLPLMDRRTFGVGRRLAHAGAPTRGVTARVGGVGCAGG